MDIVIGEGYIIKTLAISNDKKIGGLIISLSDKQNKPGEPMPGHTPDEENILCNLIFTNKQAIDLLIEDLNMIKSQMI